MIADYFNNSKALLLISLIVSNTLLLLFYFPSTNGIIFGNFYILLFVRGLRSYSNSIWSLIDAVTMKLIQDKKSYGKHRLFGSISWGISSLIAGKLIDLYGMNAMFLYGFFWSFILFLLIYFFMPQNVKNYAEHKYESLSTIDLDVATETNGEQQTDVVVNEQIDTTQDEPKYEFCQIFTLLMSMRHDYQFVFCIVIMLIYWTAMFIIERIVFIQMEQEFGATKTMMGIATLC